jgi:hypothetical protein
MESIKALRVAGYIQSRQWQLARLAAEAPGYSSVLRSRLYPAVIREMFRKPVFSPGRAVPAGAKPPSAYHLKRRFRSGPPLRWCRKSSDPGVRPALPCAFLGYVESTSSVRRLTIAGDRVPAPGQRSDRWAAPLSTGDAP